MENKDFTKINQLGDNELVDLVKSEADSQALIELENRHSPLCYNIYKKYSAPIAASGYYLPDMIDEKLNTIHSACLSFDPSFKVKFSTWLGNQIRFKCLSILNKTNRFQTSIDDENVKTKIEDEISTNEDTEGKEVIEYCKHIIDQFSDSRIKEVFRLRYFNDGCPPWNEVADELNISTQTAIDLHRKGTKLLKEKLTSQQIFDKV